MKTAPSNVLLLALGLLLMGGPWTSNTPGSAVGPVGCAAADVEVDPSGEPGEEDEYYEDEYEDEYEDVEDEIFYPSPSRRAEYEAWSNTEQSTMMWRLVDAGDLAGMKSIISADPELVYIRSEDGRGPLFWAHEYERYDMIQFLLDAGADPTAVDARGATPASMQGKDERIPGGGEEDEGGEDEYEDEEYEDEEE